MCVVQYDCKMKEQEQTEFKHSGENMEIHFSIEYVEDMGFCVGYEYRNDYVDQGTNEGDMLGEFETLEEAISYLRENMKAVIESTYYFKVCGQE